jgi:hypothetical protein
MRFGAASRTAAARRNPPLVSVTELQDTIRELLKVDDIVACLRGLVHLARWLVAPDGPPHGLCLRRVHQNPLEAVGIERIPGRVIAVVDGAGIDQLMHIYP